MKKKVIVGMSGGVDSSVAACLLAEEGFEVIGVTLHTWEKLPKTNNDSEEQNALSPTHEHEEAKQIAAAKGFLHFTIDFREAFQREVIDYFKSEYLLGRTPNPCVICNTKIKWQALLQEAKRHGAAYIATGHYARVAKQEGRFRLLQGCDASKDQSYVLWGLSQEILEKARFPLADYTKDEVRALARKYDLPVAEKDESQEICFIPDNNYERFLKDALPNLAEKIAGGKILDTNQNELGKHRGYPFYTIGQRRGLGISTPAPVYVTDIHAEDNTIVVGSKDDLLHSGLIATDLNWIAFSKLQEPFQAEAKIRYKDTAEPCVVTPLETGCVQVTFETPKRAITPGQAVVFYSGEELLGGGFIQKAIQ
ncbi:tRNA (5-methylaminomethyl-2-thiouridylate)-methyltransferase [Chloroherpeton thalassium ATCC 35110]|uniref:tRNA-specific 2-thiouridylase MnmA n=1 Tax=Chloroherpeton thalassium (strain ATCC 35110 / GB-78) TaxID=517418 RepID=B3QRT3_CHLT3|nr:tRNA 2-thiouridine(34) synthase MnmA [Chloroherpeton thalassium]ACF13886.1 tRNA (5-methylaminomethyl-2-thiouridylate)-methyltransferase [Chloroherpeton thalassium ATCC 35110]